MAAEATAYPDQPDIVSRVARAQARNRRVFLAKFFFTWIALTVGIGALMWYAGRVDADFIVRTGPFILGGAGVTIFVCLLSIAFATALAVVGAMARLSSNPFINGLASLYVSMVRGTPLLLQILFIYYALPQVGIVLPAIPAGIIALSFNYGAYMTEIFRAGIQAVPRGQREAAAALGMTERLTMRRIVLPQATRIVIPAIGNDFVAMLKDSALISVIAVPELLWRAERTGTRELQPIPALLIAAFVYWVLTMIFSFFQERTERRMARSDR